MLDHDHALALVTERPPRCSAASFRAAARPRADWAGDRQAWPRSDAHLLPETGPRRTDSGSTHEQPGLKLRPAAEGRTVPTPPVLTEIPREHIAEFGTAQNRQIFQTERGDIVGSTAYGDV